MEEVEGGDGGEMRGDDELGEAAEFDGGCDEEGVCAVEDGEGFLISGSVSFNPVI